MPQSSSIHFFGVLRWVYGWVVTTAVGISTLAFSAHVEAQEGTRNGALLGGAAGAVIGGVVGNNHHDQTAEGALIGGAVGAVAGGLLGHHRDQAIAQRQQQQRQLNYYNGVPHNYRTYPASRTRSPYRVSSAQRSAVVGAGQPTIVYQAPVVGRYGVYRSPTRPVPTQVRQPVLMSDVIHMTRNRVSDAVIVSHIQANGMAAQPSVDDVVTLSQEGVSDYVITAMQNVSAVEVLVEPGIATPSPTIERELRPGELMPLPPLQSQRRGF